jgi:hypothetical protein
MLDFLTNDFKIGPIGDNHKMNQFKLELDHWKIKNYFDKVEVINDQKLKLNCEM